MEPADISQTIVQNLAEVRAGIAAAAASAGRRAEDIRIVAVSKTLPESTVAAAVAAGLRDFGENTIQEALVKIGRFAAENLQWHFIGHLQSNKAKFLPGHFQWWHSLDNAGVAQRVSRKAADSGATINALIEVNITRDPNKHGVSVEQLFPLMDTLLGTPTPGLALRGLMAIGPQAPEEAQLRAAFAAVRVLRDEVARRYALPGFTELSMGMSGDYAPAIREGSTMVRLGTAVFGARNYPKRTPRR